MCISLTGPLSEASSPSIVVGPRFPSKNKMPQSSPTAHVLGEFPPTTPEHRSALLFESASASLAVLFFTPISYFLLCLLPAMHCYRFPALCTGHGY